MRGLCYFFLSILTQVSSTFSQLIGLLGHNVTLPCRYDSQAHGILSFCWGRGKVPSSKCSNTILSSEGGAVQFRQSPRYQLLGRVTDGDVSLTIMNAQLADAGAYGCRVEIPGWFNDYKVNKHLVMEEAAVEELFTDDWTPTTDWMQETLTTSTPETFIGDFAASTEEEFKDFLDVENIGRMAVIFFSTITIILILVFIFWRRCLPKKTLIDTRLNVSTAENIYEFMHPSA
ncbi:T-cell immunoglobulin and mucin domain-containing protein 4-like [Morone saxatilis]|uniref:T-cell immunoglobulin and mucin domain-containing protein 4-like n=1 Tax=Morone saxatilis TaxID=34816 RepID=UPI0015E1CBC5|nr:T-cell immunoglobulin and mucin domain-containing protein 4-like [Morone saxatilis]